MEPFIGLYCAGTGTVVGTGYWEFLLLGMPIATDTIVRGIMLSNGPRQITVCDFGGFISSDRGGL
eukprot:801035-Rhodomonas_salina.3